MKLARIAIPVLVTALLAGACSSDGDSAEDTTTTTESMVEDSSTTVAAYERPDVQFTGEEADVAAAFSTFFDNDATLEQRVASLENGATFSDAIAAQIESGLQEGIELLPTAVAIEGDTATVTFDIVQDGNIPLAPGQTGPMKKIDGTWVVASDLYCGLLALQGTVLDACNAG